MLAAMPPLFCIPPPPTPLEETGEVGSSTSRTEKALERALLVVEVVREPMLPVLY